MTATHAVYLKSPSYGQSGYGARTMTNAPLHRHYGGILGCPRCGLPMTVAQEQLEHRDEPFSVTCTEFKDGVVSRGSRCGAHFVFGDPEEPATRADLPAATLRYLEDDFNWPAFRRPIGWHADVG